MGNFKRVRTAEVTPTDQAVIDMISNLQDALDKLRSAQDRDDEAAKRRNGGRVPDHDLMIGQIIEEIEEKIDELRSVQEADIASYSKEGINVSSRLRKVAEGDGIRVKGFNPSFAGMGPCFELAATSKYPAGTSIGDVDDQDEVDKIEREVFRQVAENPHGIPGLTEWWEGVKHGNKNNDFEDGFADWKDIKDWAEYCMNNPEEGMDFEFV